MSEGLVANGNDVAVTADFRGLALAEVKVRRAGFDEDLEKLVDVSHLMRMGEKWVSVRNAAA